LDSKRSSRLEEYLRVPALVESEMGEAGLSGLDSMFLAQSMSWEEKKKIRLGG